MKAACYDVACTVGRTWVRVSVQTGGFGSRMGFSRSRAGEHRIWTLRLGQRCGPRQVTFRAQWKPTRASA